LLDRKEEADGAGVVCMFKCINYPRRRTYATFSFGKSKAELVYIQISRQHKQRSTTHTVKGHSKQHHGIVTVFIVCKDERGDKAHTHTHTHREDLVSRRQLPFAI